MRADRAAAGFSGAAILVVIALAPGGAAVFEDILFATAALMVLGTLAPILPFLHELPLVGAPRVELRLSVEDKESDIRAQGHRILRVGIMNKGPANSGVRSCRCSCPDLTTLWLATTSATANPDADNACLTPASP